MTCNNARTLSIVITSNHMHLDVIQLSFSFVRIAVVSCCFESRDVPVCFL